VSSWQRPQAGRTVLHNCGTKGCGKILKGKSSDEIGMIASGFLQETEPVIWKNRLVRGKQEWHQSVVVSRQ